MYFLVAVMEKTKGASPGALGPTPFDKIMDWPLP